MNINAKTVITGLIGYPVEHSMSPAMHNAAFTHLGLNNCYIAMPVPPGSLTRAIEGIRALNFRGINVTVPHKENVLLMLDEVDKEAAFIGAVNTIVNDKGRLKGFNTDGRGFMRSMQDEGIEHAGSSVIIIGTGGAARAISYYISERASEVRLFDIDLAKAGSLAADLKELGRNVVSVEDARDIPGSDIIINATPLGLHTDDPLPFDIEMLTTSNRVIDLIYWDTPVLSAAAKKGCKVMNGLGMLLHQGALAFELWTGLDAPVGIMKKTLLEGISPG